MQKNLFARLGVITLALTMVTTCLMGGTLAKYTTTVTGNGSVTAAKFDFNKNTSATWATQTTLGATANVGYADTGIELYPGQTGTITLPYHFESDVDAVYTPGFNVEGTGVFATIANYDNSGTTFEDIDLTFIIQDSAAQAGSTYAPGNTTKISLKDLNAGLQAAFKAAIGADASDKIDATAGVKDGTITITWAWGMDTNNAVDTLNGLAATGMYVKTTDRTLIDATTYNTLSVEDKANYTQITGANDVTVTFGATIAQDQIV